MAIAPVLTVRSVMLRVENRAPNRDVSVFGAKVLHSLARTVAKFFRSGLEAALS